MKKILIAEDNRDLASTLKLALEAEGYSVELAESGREAIAAQRAAPADILITDLVMPEGDGFETIDTFQKEFPATKLLVVSGNNRLESARYLDAAKLMGAQAVFQKPFAIDALLRTLKEL